MSRDKLWRIETGQSPVKAGDVAALCWAYKVDPETTERLAAFSSRTLEQIVYEKSSDTMPSRLRSGRQSWIGMFVELEGSANVISNYDPELVPGLLQTPNYARAIFEAARPSLIPEVVERRVNSRIRRSHNVLNSAVRPQLNSVLNEAVLARQVGGPEVMTNQIAHLRTLNATDQVSVRVLPLRAGAHAAMEGAFTLLEFDDVDQPEVVYQENRAGAVYLEHQDEVADYRVMFAAISEQSICLDDYTPGAQFVSAAT